MSVAPPPAMKRGSMDGAGAGKLGRIMEAPLRALCRARDRYVTGMTGIADRTSSSSRGVGRHPSRSPSPGAYAGRFTRSLGGAASSGEDDLRELVRAAASHGSPGGSPGPGAGSRLGSAAVPRSRSVAMARIDEERPCDFGGDVPVVGVIVRSRSCEVPSNKRVGWG